MSSNGPDRKMSYRIKDEIFCFAHLQWCHNGWASNIFIYPPRLKYWMPIHYDTIKDGQKKKNHLLFSFLVKIVSFCISSAEFVKNMIKSFHWHHLNNCTPYENKCFNPRNQNHCVAFVTRVNFVCVQDSLHDTQSSRALNTQLPSEIAERAIHHGVVMDWRSFCQNQ